MRRTRACEPVPATGIEKGARGRRSASGSLQTRRASVASSKGIHEHQNKPLPKFEVPAKLRNMPKAATYGYARKQADSFAAYKARRLVGRRRCNSIRLPSSRPPLSRKAPSPPPTTNSPDGPRSPDRVNAVVMCIGSQNALREALYKTLAFCEQPRDFTEVEDFIAATDEFVYSHIMQTPFTMIGMLTDAGGLSQTPLDEAGDPVTAEQLANLTADEADDLVATYRIRSHRRGPRGRAPAGSRAPHRAQLSLRPHRRDTYFAVLDFCTTPRKFPEIEAFFKATPGFPRTSWRIAQAFARLLRRQARQGQGVGLEKGLGCNRRRQADAGGAQAADRERSIALGKRGTPCEAMGSVEKGRAHFVFCQLSCSRFVFPPALCPPRPAFAHCRKWDKGLSLCPIPSPVSTRSYRRVKQATKRRRKLCPRL